MRRQLLALALGAGLLVSCGDNSSSQTVPADTSLAATSPSTPSATGAAVAAPEALQFTAPLVGGGSLDFTQYSGRTVALWFWAPT